MTPVLLFPVDAAILVGGMAGERARGSNAFVSELDLVHAMVTVGVGWRP